MSVPASQWMSSQRVENSDQESDRGVSSFSKRMNINAPDPHAIAVLLLTGLALFFLPAAFQRKRPAC